MAENSAVREGGGPLCEDCGKPIDEGAHPLKVGDLVEAFVRCGRNEVRRIFTVEDVSTYAAADRRIHHFASGTPTPGPLTFDGAIAGLRNRRGRRSRATAPRRTTSCSRGGGDAAMTRQAISLADATVKAALAGAYAAEKTEAGRP